MVGAVAVRTLQFLWPKSWRGRAVLIAGASVIVLAAAYGVLWLVVASRLETQLRDAIASRNSDTLSVSHGEIKRSGFPAKLVLEVENPSYVYTWHRSDGARATLTWFDRWMTARASPFRPTVIVIEWPKHAEIAVDAVDGKVTPPIAFTAARAVAELWLTGERALPLKAELSNIRAARAGTNEPIDVLESLRIDGVYGDGQGEPSAHWRFDAVNLRAAELGGTVFGPSAAPAFQHIDRLNGEVKVHGPLPEPSSNAAMAAWRDAGGRIEMPSGALHSPTFQAAWQGTLSLDQEMRPLSQIDTTVVGLNRVVENSAAAPAETGDPLESLAVLLLGLLSGQDDPDAPMHVTLETRDGKVYAGSALGSIRVGKVGPIDFEAEDGPHIPFKFRFGG